MLKVSNKMDQNFTLILLTFSIHFSDKQKQHAELSGDILNSSIKFIKRKGLKSLDEIDKVHIDVNETLVEAFNWIRLEEEKATHDLEDQDQYDFHLKKTLELYRDVSGKIKKTVQILISNYSLNGFIIDSQLFEDGDTGKSPPQKSK